MGNRRKETDTFARAAAWAVATLIVLAGPAHASPDTFSPTTLNDTAGNEANYFSKIVWAAAPLQGEYRITEENVDYDAGSLKPFYNMVNYFLDTVFVHDTPFGQFPSRRMFCAGKIYVVGLRLCKSL